MLMALIALTVFLGVWQLWRAQQKSQLLAEIAQQQALPPLAWSHGVPPAWRRVQLQGQWLNQYEIWLDHRIHEGQVGYQIVTPFRLKDGSIIMVNRGWWAAGEQKLPLPAKQAPMVQVQAWPRYLSLGSSAVDGRIFQNMDPGRFAAWAYLPLPSAYAIAMQNDTGLAAIEAERPFGVERHLAYALSWFLMAMCGWFLLRRYYLKA